MQTEEARRSIKRYIPCLFIAFIAFISLVVAFPSFPSSDWHTYLCWTIAINPQSKPPSCAVLLSFLVPILYLVYTVIVPSQHIPSCFFVRKTALLPFSSLQLKRLTYQQWLDWLFVWLPPPVGDTHEAKREKINGEGGRKRGRENRAVRERESVLWFDAKPIALHCVSDSIVLCRGIAYLYLCVFVYMFEYVCAVYLCCVCFYPCLADLSVLSSSALVAFSAVNLHSIMWGNDKWRKLEYF